MAVDTCGPCNSGDSESTRAPLGQRLVTLGAVLVPFAGLAAAVVLLWGMPFYWTYVGVFALMFVLTSLGVGVGFHRLFTHRAFETNAVMRFIWAVLGSMAVEGSVIKWVGIHRVHHQHTDVPGDPHSPHLCENNFGGMLKGMWHAHMGWFFDKNPPDLERQVPDLAKDRGVRFVSNTFVLWVILGLVIP